MTGKEKCKILKEIRAQIAQANEIPWVTEECPYTKNCPGTCPKCEAEVRALERALENRRARGKAVILTELLKAKIDPTSDSEQPIFLFPEPTGYSDSEIWAQSDDDSSVASKMAEVDGQFAAPAFDDWGEGGSAAPSEPEALDGQIAAPTLDGDFWGFEII